MRKCIVIALSVFIAGSAFAGLAPWNGQPNTTYQSWSFSTNAEVGIAPDVDGNPYGDPTATVSYNAPVSPYIEVHEGHSGVWYLSSSDWIEFYIPNTGNDAPDTYKEVWIDVVYWADVGGAQFFSAPSISGGVQEIESVDAGGGYVRSTYSFIIEPNPTEELIYLMSQSCTVYVDEIVIETICVPEPATLALLGLGGLLLRKRRV